MPDTQLTASPLDLVAPTGNDEVEKRKKAAKDEAASYFANYSEYNKQLRTWFVTFGLGGPILFYTQPALLEKLTNTERAWVVWAFLVGCGTQIALAVLNKGISWTEYNYQESLANGIQRNRNWWEDRLHWLGARYWIDVLFDVLTTGAFATAVFCLTNAALNAAAVVSATMPP